jgi:hypothetical protein
VEAYRIDRFGSVDGIVLRSSEDPPAQGDPDAGARELVRQSRTLAPAPYRAAISAGSGST